MDTSVKPADLIEEVSASSKEQEENMEHVNKILEGIKIASERKNKIGKQPNGKPTSRRYNTYKG